VNILLDENTPVQLIEPLRLILRNGHAVEHVQTLKWKSKKDRDLLPDAAKRGFDVLVTQDSNQLQDPEECRLLKKAGLHHVRFKGGGGLKGVGRAMGAVLIAMPDIVEDLSDAKGQRLVQIFSVNAGAKRFTSIDPVQTPPPYWP